MIITSISFQNFYSLDFEGRSQIRFLPYGIHKSKGEEFKLPFPLTDL